jgi:hypothetical protein
MAELKTKLNNRSVDRFLSGISDERKREDCLTLLAMMKQITKAEPKMWGSSIVGFGTYHYKYQSGREGDWFLAGFSPRKQNVTVYIMAGFEELDELLKKLGKHSTGKGCLYFKRLEDIHVPTLKKLVQQSVKQVTRRSRTTA